MTVLLAYVRTPEGDAAPAPAREEARLRSTGAVVVNATRPAADLYERVSSGSRKAFRHLSV